MKAATFIYILMFLLIWGCEEPSKHGNDERPKTPSTFSNNGNMLLGNILVAEFGKYIYGKSIEKQETAKKTKKDIMANPNDSQVKTNFKEEYKVPNNQNHLKFLFK